MMGIPVSFLPQWGDARFNLAWMLFWQARFAETPREEEVFLRFELRNAAGHRFAGVTLAHLGRPEEALVTSEPCDASPGARP